MTTFPLRKKSHLSARMGGVNARHMTKPIIQPTGDNLRQS
jgi:hypothetical protein